MKKNCFKDFFDYNLETCILILNILDKNRTNSHIFQFCNNQYNRKVNCQCQNVDYKSEL